MHLNLASSGNPSPFSSQGSKPDYEEQVRIALRYDLPTVPANLIVPAVVNSKIENGCLVFPTPSGEITAISLLRVEGLSKSGENNKELPSSSENSVAPPSAQVLSGMSGQGASIVYFLCGQGPLVRIFMGVRAQAGASTAATQAARNALESLKTCLAATYSDIKLRDLKSDADYRDVQSKLGALDWSASLVGNPAQASSNESAINSMDSAVEALAGTTFGYWVEAKPISVQDLLSTFSQLGVRIGETHAHVKQTASTKQTSIDDASHEELDRFAQQYEEILNDAFQKVDVGLRTGMWDTSVTILASTEPVLKRVASVMCAIFAGPDSKPEPLKLVYHSHTRIAKTAVLSLGAIPCGTSRGDVAELVDAPLQTPLSSSDLAIFTDLPRTEAPGFRVSEPRDFAVDIDQPTGKSVDLGTVLGSKGIAVGAFRFDLNDLTRHALIVGLTGSGKTNTSMHLLHELWVRNKIPFLVVEPAKAQYRNLLAVNGFGDIQVFSPGLSSLGLAVNNLGSVAPFRLNPFEIPSGVDPQRHISNLYTVFNAAFILYAPMPYVLERALYEIYEDKGWDLSTGRHPDADPKTNTAPAMAFPTLSDLYAKISDVVNRLGYDSRVRMDVTAGLTARVDSLRVGQKGQTFDCHIGIPFSALLGKPTIIELSHLGSDEEKAFIMGLIFARLYEHCETAGEYAGLRHVTLIEEAHRLLARTSTDTSDSEVANVKGKSVETFCNLLAEIRAYGEGLVVVEQIPSKLADDLIKNTNLKIMHRIVAADDRETMGGAMNLLEEQEASITALPKGQAAVYAECVERPILLQIPLFPGGNAKISNDRVHAAATNFYTRHPNVLRQWPGCATCRVACRYSANTSRSLSIAPWRIGVIWKYALAWLSEPKSVLSSWPQLSRELLLEAEKMQLSAKDADELAWCIYTIGCPRAFRHVRTTIPFSIRNLEELVSLFAQLGAITREKQVGKEIEAKAIALTNRAIQMLRTTTGPMKECSVCKSKCMFGPAAPMYLSANPPQQEALEDLKSLKEPQRLRGYCEKYAHKMLAISAPNGISGAALCIFVHLANRAGVADVSRAAAIVFRNPSTQPRPKP
jgi:enamine deaminase RidA (YjgF/YER057c/UK114 family)